MIRKTLLTIIALLTASAADAQIPEYTELKEALNEKSLPLVNLSVDIEDVSKAVYTDATMEIADPLRRTDGESQPLAHAAHGSAVGTGFQRPCGRIRPLVYRVGGMGARVPYVERQPRTTRPRPKRRNGIYKGLVP